MEPELLFALLGTALLGVLAIRCITLVPSTALSLVAGFRRFDSLDQPELRVDLAAVLAAS